MLFALLYCLCLVVPGWLLLSFFRIGGMANWYLYPVASLGFFASLSVVFALTGSSAASFSYFYFLFVLGMALVMVKRLYVVRITAQGKSALAIQWHSVKTLLPLGLIAGLFVYALFVGPYMEIPGDPLWHLLKIGEATEHWQSGEVWEFKQRIRVLSVPNYHWYHFCGWLIELTQTNLRDVTSTIWVVNFVVFTSAFYFFALRVFRETELGESQQVWAAVIAVIFLVLHFGIGPFSYVRYYAFAPSFLALLGYWSALIVIMDFFSGRAGLVKTVLLGGFVTFTTMLLHHQEVLFIVVMSVLLSGTVFWRWIVSSRGASWKAYCLKLKTEPSAQIICFVFFVVVIGYLAIHGYLYVSRVRNYALEGGWLRPVSDTLPILKHLFILKPDGQFFQVLTVWGVWGYLVYLLHAFRFRFPSIVACAMWAPLWTVFNPVFIDFFLRLTYPEVVWRLVYLVPIELALALLMVVWVNNLNKPTGVRSTLSVVGTGLMVCVSIVLLFPLNAGVVKNQYAKFDMLSPVSVPADHRLMDDLFHELERIPKSRILTDQVTGYVINALSKHEYGGHKFYGHGALNTKRNGYNLADFSPYQDALLIINQRQGSVSEIGRVSGHWPENIRVYSDWYSPEFLEFIRQNPGSFKRITDMDGIAIYVIDLS